jgi:hypothetical protein
VTLKDDPAPKLGMTLSHHILTPNQTHPKVTGTAGSELPSYISENDRFLCSKFEGNPITFLFLSVFFLQKQVTRNQTKIGFSRRVVQTLFPFTFPMCVSLHEISALFMQRVVRPSLLQDLCILKVFEAAKSLLLYKTLV